MLVSMPLKWLSTSPAQNKKLPLDPDFWHFEQLVLWLCLAAVFVATTCQAWVMIYWHQRDPFWEPLCLFTGVVAFAVLATFGKLRGLLSPTIVEQGVNARTSVLISVLLVLSVLFAMAPAAF